jgi:hypothetical protein
VDKKELRIGNLVMYSSIITVDENKIRECVEHPDRFGPLGITPEWLERLGCKKRKDDGPYGYRYNVYWDTDSLFVIEKDWREEPSHFFGIEYTDSPDPKDDGHVHHFAFEIKWVHQLQNLYFALTGEELEFTLDTPQT